MCIRDSIVLGYIWLLLLNGILGFWERSITYSATYGFWGMAVSYTHLRAHETVLDLVCRLLLEKKKNKQPLIHVRYHKMNTTKCMTNKLVTTTSESIGYHST